MFPAESRLRDAGSSSSTMVHFFPFIVSALFLADSGICRRNDGIRSRHTEKTGVRSSVPIATYSVKCSMKGCQDSSNTSGARCTASLDERFRFPPFFRVSQKRRASLTGYGFPSGPLSCMVSSSALSLGRALMTNCTSSAFSC